MKDDSVSLPTPLRIVVLGALVTALFGCHGASQPRRSEIHLTCNTCLEQNPDRAIGRRDLSMKDVRDLTMRATNFPVESITERTLRGLIETMPPGKQLVLVTPSGENWIFYISFNFEEPVVLLELTGTDAMRVNGRACSRPLTLMPGAHGFSVKANGSEIEHRFLPMKGDRAASVGEEKVGSGFQSSQRTRLCITLGIVADLEYNRNCQRRVSDPDEAAQPGTSGDST